MVMERNGQRAAGLPRGGSAAAPSLICPQTSNTFTSVAGRPCTALPMPIPIPKRQQDSMHRNAKHMCCRQNIGSGDPRPPPTGAELLSEALGLPGSFSDSWVCAPRARASASLEPRAPAGS